ncbi:MAG: type III-B CRISPR module-associated protein Cmr5 [Thermoproteota archaeon]
MTVNPTRKAIEDFDKLVGLVDREVGNSFRARARSIPSMMEDVGLVPALSFCFASATKDLYDKVVKAWEEGKKEEMRMEKEKGGYALYLFLTLSYLKELGFVADVRNPVDGLKKLVDVQALASKVLKTYCVQMKRLAEAVYGEK